MNIQQVMDSGKWKISLMENEEKEYKSRFEFKC
jgi:hypothetical protein